MQITRRWLLAGVVLLAGCGGGDPSTSSIEKVNAAAQRALSEKALASLDSRRCEALPEKARLAALPSDELACLGTGPSRPADAGDGRPTVVNLWASWCAPCVREMPALQAVHAKTQGGVRFVGVDTQDKKDSAAGLLQATGVTYEQRDDPDGVVRAALRAPGLPVTVVYDTRGREVSRRFGELKGDWLEQALADAGAPPLRPGG